MPAPTTQFFTGRMPFLPPNQQRQSIEGNTLRMEHTHNRLTAFCPGLPGRPVPEEIFTHSHPS